MYRRQANHSIIWVILACLILIQTPSEALDCYECQTDSSGNCTTHRTTCGVQIFDFNVESIDHEDSRILSTLTNPTSNPSTIGRNTFNNSDNYSCYYVKGVGPDGETQEKKGCMRKDSSCESITSQLAWKDVKCTICNFSMCNWLMLDICVKCMVNTFIIIGIAILVIPIVIIAGVIIICTCMRSKTQTSLPSVGQEKKIQSVS